MTRLRRARLLPALIGAMGLLIVAKLGGAGMALLAAGTGGRVDLIAAAQAEATPRPAATPPAPPQSPAPVQASAPAPAQPPRPAPSAAPGASATPAAAQAETACEVPRTDAAERALLEQLRARRGEIERREQVAAEREVVLAAAERRLAERVESLAALQARIEAAEQTRTEREEAGWRQMVKLYEGMRPRDAAAIFDDLDGPVLLQILARMGERKAAPIVAAMRPDRARQITTDLSRYRAPSPTN